MDRTERLILALQVERIGQSDSHMRIVDGDAVTRSSTEPPISTTTKRPRAFLEWLQHHRPEVAPNAVGHRLVHGGRAHRAPQVLTADVLTDLRQLVPSIPIICPRRSPSSR